MREKLSKMCQKTVQLVEKREKLSQFVLASKNLSMQEGL
jgi:chorismate mutase